MYPKQIDWFLYMSYIILWAGQNQNIRTYGPDLLSVSQMWCYMRLVSAIISVVLSWNNVLQFYSFPFTYILIYINSKKLHAHKAPGVFYWSRKSACLRHEQKSSWLCVTLRKMRESRGKKRKLIYSKTEYASGCLKILQRNMKARRSALETNTEGQIVVFHLGTTLLKSSRNIAAEVM